MRLNFSGVGDDDIREGVRRIGEVVREQIGLYGTLTGAEPAKQPGRARTESGAAAPAGGQREASEAAAEGRVVPLQRKTG